MVKTLILHPEDDPVRGPWANIKWDCIIDLGKSTPNSYCRWKEFFACPITAASTPAGEDYAQIRRALSRGLGSLVDEHGLDWWDLIALEFHSQLEQTARLRRMSQGIGAQDEVFVSRPGFHTRILSAILGRPVHSFTSERAVLRRLRHYSAVLAKFSVAQLLQIVGDKYDTGYQLRRFINPRGKTCREPVVLLPSAYVNVTRTGLQYAETLPNTQFLLVATRLSGWVSQIPTNVRMRKLASYARRDTSRTEFDQLVTAWTRLKARLMDDPILSVAFSSGVFDSFLRFMRDGLMIRDTWLQVFEQEPIAAVLCADDANFTTRIPLLLARKRGLGTVSCHHGALDGRYRLRPKPEYLLLTKGRMEKEYLINCGVPAECIEVGAPLSTFKIKRAAHRAPWIVFFSDAYEVIGGRAMEFYRELLPPLAQLATATARQLVIKLHPAESLRERKTLAKSVLPDQQFRRLSFISGPLTDELLASTAFALTVVSTAAVECAMRGIPAFILPGLDYSNYGYAEQFSNFGAGIRLNAADEIASIPEKIAHWSPPIASELWQPIRPERLAQLLSGRELAAAVAV